MVFTVTSRSSITFSFTNLTHSNEPYNLGQSENLIFVSFNSCRFRSWRTLKTQNEIHQISYTENECRFKWLSLIFTRKKSNNCLLSTKCQRNRYDSLITEYPTKCRLYSKTMNFPFENLCDSAAFYLTKQNIYIRLSLTKISL